MGSSGTKLVALLDQYGYVVEDDFPIPDRLITVIFHDGAAWVRFGVNSRCYRWVPHWASTNTPSSGVFKVIKLEDKDEASSASVDPVS